MITTTVDFPWGSVGHLVLGHETLAVDVLLYQATSFSGVCPGWLGSVWLAGSGA